MASSGVGEQLGPYRLLGRLGRGGMGVVYAAEHVRLGRRAALKLLAPQLGADPAFRERFVRESQLLAAIEHPNIIPIYDAGEADGLLYIAVRYVEGTDLAKLIEQEGALPVDRALSIVEQAGSALDAAHARGLVHRDVKPANILLDQPTGRVFLTDFGVAKRQGDDRTATGLIMGTIHYAAPEQVQGQAVGPPADVYALGGVLFEALSGRKTFEKETDVAVIFAHALEAPPALSELRPDLPPAIDRVIETALAKDPADRYESCGALVADARAALGAEVEGEPDLGVRPSVELAAAPLASNLPSPPLPLIGRQREVDELERLLRGSDVRLLTLTGPGGTGKTRLAVEVATSVADAFPGGAVFVDLVPVSQPDLVMPALAETLGVEEGSDSARATSAMLEAVCARLQGSPRLLVLDNFEHLLPAARIVSDLLAAVPTLKVVVTSQASLKLGYEHEYVVPPLALPEPEEAAEVDAAARSPAVALFVDRARAVAPDFELTVDNVSAVTGICARLDGLPLAIELAVARLRVLSPEMILARLESALDLLTAGPRDLPARHRTLRAAIDWSYELLEPEGQTIFQRLAVFAGGFTLDAAEVVCTTGDGGADVLRTVESLLDQSLLRPADSGGRFRMLQSIQEYALFRLLERGDADELRRRHARHYLSLAVSAQPELVGPDQAAWVRRLDAEVGNLRAAFDWALESDELELGLRAAWALTRFWSVAGHMSEGRQWLNQALDRASGVDPAVRARALFAAGYGALGQGDFEDASTRFGESLALAREIGDDHAVAMSLAQLGWLVAARGEGTRAIAISEESLALARRLRDPRTASVALANLAETAVARGDYDRAAKLFGESLALRRDAGDSRNVANALLELGRIELARGEDQRAVSLLDEGLRLARELGDTWGVSVALASLGGVALARGDYDGAAEPLTQSLVLCSERRDKRLAAECLAGLALVALEHDDPVRAARLGGAADRMRKAVGAAPSSVERVLDDRHRWAGPAALGPAAFEAERQRGAALPFADAVAYGLEAARSARPASQI